MSDLAVVYLARPESGPHHIRAFATSYQSCEAGCDHDLVVCVKSRRPDAEDVVASAFGGIPHTVVRVPDDVGYDLHAYRDVARQIAHEWVCFCNTYTEIVASDWLKTLRAGLDAFGLVGASGSFQSLASVDELHARAHWIFTYPAAFDAAFTRRYVCLLGSESALSAPLHSLTARWRRRVGDALKRRPSVRSLIGLAERTGWAGANADPSAWAGVSFPPFPNPHVRTNVFLLARTTFLDAAARLGSSKLDCYVFESGHEGLSCHVLRSGQALGLAGRDGTLYRVPDWPRSGGFRSGDQGNLLATDNRTAESLTYDPLARELLDYLTWGNEAPHAPANGYLGITMPTAGTWDADAPPRTRRPTDAEPLEPSRPASAGER